MNFKIKFLTIIFLLSFCSLVFCVKASAEVKTFTVSAKAFIGDNQTKNDARMLATLEAKRKALEQAGTYLESLTIVENFQLKKDEILAFTAGVAKTEIIEEKPIVEGSSFGLEITAQVTVDTSILAEKIKKLKEDNSLLEQNKQLIQRTNELEEELLKITKELAAAKNKNTINKLQKEDMVNFKNKYTATEWFDKGLDAYQKQDWENVIYFNTKAIEITPEFADAYNWRAIGYLNKMPEDLNKALDDLNKAILLKPNLGIAYSRRCLIYSEKKLWTEAFKDCDQAILLNPESAIVWGNRGIAYDDKGDYNSAISDYTKAIELNPQLADTYYNRGVAYNDKGDYDSAISDCTKAIELNPQDADAYYVTRGNAYYNKGNYASAISDYTKAIQLNPQDAMAYNNRGSAYALKGDYDSAISDYTKAITLDNDPLATQYAYNNRGVDYGKKGNYNSAISDYNKAINLNPQYANAYNNRGIAYEKKGNCLKANEDYKKACSLGLSDACSYKCN